ncbi:MAG: GntR family transcriptional regulator [Spirochaetes bacterium]|nr:GntR family transcriptional regulator [Spirochaetota bacterium]
MTIVQLVTEPKEEMKEFNFVLDSKSGIPVYRQIIQQIELAISTDELKVGDQLPTVRSLAIQLKVNPNTVAKAYSELEIRGLVNTQVGSGTFISEKRVEMSEIEKKQKIEEIVVNCLNQLKPYGLGKEELINFLRNYRVEENN